MPAGIVLAIMSSCSRTASAVFTALAPGASCTPAKVAGLPFSLLTKVNDCGPSSTRATSPSTTFEPFAFARSTIFANCSGDVSWPCAVSGTVTRWPGRAGAAPRLPGAICTFCWATAFVRSFIDRP